MESLRPPYLAFTSYEGMCSRDRIGQDRFRRISKRITYCAIRTGIQRRTSPRDQLSLNVTPATFHNAASPKTSKKPVSDSYHSGCILAPSPSPRTVIQDPYQDIIGRSLAQIDIVLPQPTNQHIPTCSVAPPCGDLPCDTQAGESVAETRCSIGRLGYLRSWTERRKNAGFVS
jgi:hypothetical protein